MRTSSMQFELLVEYMERNGDLSKPTEGPQGRAKNIQHWENLTHLLNADATGDKKTAEKWRKVWSDFKNNSKKKAARIYRAARGTGGGPASNTKLSHLEQRAINVVGTQAVTGIVEIPEIGLEDELTEQPSLPHCQIKTIQSQEQEVHCTTEEWNRPGTSSQPSLFPEDSREPEANGRYPIAPEPGPHVVDSAPAVIVPPLNPDIGSRQCVTHTSTPLPLSPCRRSTPLPLTPRRLRRGQDILSPTRRIRRTRTQTQSEMAREAFVRSDCEWRAFQQETERERLRLRELEIRNQDRWVDMIGQVLALGNRFLNIYENK